MTSTRDPKAMSADERRREIAGLLAQALVRYHVVTKLGLPATPAEIRHHSQNCLEQSGENRLHVSQGAGG